MTIKNASEKSFNSCTKDKDPDQAAKILRYKKIMKFLPIEGRKGLKDSYLDGMVEKCVRFKLTIKSDITWYSGYTTTLAEASGDGFILLNDSMKLTGSGQVVNTCYETLGLPDRTGNIPEVWKFDIPEFDLVTSATGPKFNLVVDLHATESSLVYACPSATGDF